MKGGEGGARWGVKVEGYRSRVERVGQLVPRLARVFLAHGIERAAEVEL